MPERLRLGRAPLGERLITTAIWAAALVVLGFFVLILADLLIGGLSRISWDFLSSAPRNAGREGGIFPIIVSTLAILGVCMGVTLPLGLATAMVLAEYGRHGTRLAVLIGRSLDTLAGVPSIVFGLFGNVFFSKILGLGFSILSGGLTLSCMVLPILIRTTEEGLRAVPDAYRMNAAALGLRRSTTLARILLPAALPGLTAGFVLGVGRALAETAALIFTSGYVDRLPESLLDSGRALSIHVYDLSMNVAGGNASAYASALVLMTLLLLINLTASALLRMGHSRRRRFD